MCFLSVGLRAEKLPTLAPQTPAEKQLEAMARELRLRKSAASYSRLSAWERRPSAGKLAPRAALALGYFDYTQGRYPQARAWLEQAQADPLLREYALYWAAETDLARGKSSEALASLESLRRDFPDSVMAEPALESLCDAALAANQPAQCLAALAGYSKTRSRPSLLFAQARAQEQIGQPAAAASSYLSLYHDFPLAPEAPEAGLKARALERPLAEKFPAPSLAERMQRAEILYQARRWRDARSDFLELLPKLRDQDRERAELRVARGEAEGGGSTHALSSLSLTDPLLEAERLYYLTEAFRSRKQPAEMTAAAEQAVARDPQGPWAEAALFTAGNYFWVNLDADRAGAYYRRVLEIQPLGKDAPAAHWRLAWTAYRQSRSEAPELLEEHLRRYPGSPFTSDALYWLGRTAERSGDSGRARSFYRKAAERFPQTYFGRLADQRLARLDPVPASSEDVLSLVPPPPAVASFAEDVPPAATDHWQRAEALRSIAFDASAELEFRAAYAATGAPILLVEAARAADSASHYMAAAAAVRLIFPQLEARQFGDAPDEIWRLVYPLPFLSDIRQASGRSHTDAMLVAGLIRQESGFQEDAVSRAGAVGLMQLLPVTARKMARQGHVRYARQKLLEPGYNLRLGTLYLANLIRSLGSLEAALAAYNAGEDRVAAWQAGQHFEEPAEFVESIPFTETREYVEVVSRNAEIYRHFYGGGR